MTVAAAAAQLSDAAIAPASAELERELGRPPTLGELARIHRRPDGTFVMSHRRPTVTIRELGEFVDRPWHHPGQCGLNAIDGFGSIAEVARMLLNPESDDGEMARREALLEEEQRRRQASNEAARAQDVRDEIAARGQRQREARAYEQFGGDDWSRLPLEAKCLYAAALAVEAGVDLATELRRLGAIVAKSNTLPFPGRRWR